jgi:hypothetical protein
MHYTICTLAASSLGHDFSLTTLTTANDIAAMLGDYLGRFESDGSLFLSPNNQIRTPHTRLTGIRYAPGTSPLHRLITTRLVGFRSYPFGVATGEHATKEDEQATTACKKMHRQRRILYNLYKLIGCFSRPEIRFH